MPKTYSEIPGVIVLAENEQGKIILCSSKGPRPTIAGLFANGCIMLDLSEGKMYYNSGSLASPVWNSVADISEAEIADGAITNAKVNVAAAIAKTKLAALDIVNADINAAAAIAGTKFSDNAVTSAKVDPLVIKTAEVALSAANIIAMYTTPITLVAAVEAKTIVVDDICLKMVRSGTAFADGGEVEFRYTNNAGAKVTADIAVAVIRGGEGTVYNVNKSIVTSLVGVVNSPIVITNATGVFATGTGTATVTVRYHLLN